MNFKFVPDIAIVDCCVGDFCWGSLWGIANYPAHVDPLVGTPSTSPCIMLEGEFGKYHDFANDCFGKNEISKIPLPSESGCKWKGWRTREAYRRGSLLNHPM